MYKKLLIFLFTIVAIGCKSTNEEDINLTESEQKDVKNPFTAFELIDSSNNNMLSLYRIPDLSVDKDTSIANVDYVQLEPYLKDDDTEYKDLRYVLRENEFETILYQDTLYLKFFQRKLGREGGVRVKVLNDEFSTCLYSYFDVSEIYHPNILTPLPYSEVEQYVDSGFVANKQVLLLNKRKYELGDTIFGKIFYEGIRAYNTRIPVQASVYLKDTFKGVVKEGKQFTLTTSKKHLRAF